MQCMRCGREFSAAPTYCVCGAPLADWSPTVALAAAQPDAPAPPWPGPPGDDATEPASHALICDDQTIQDAPAAPPSHAMADEAHGPPPTPDVPLYTVGWQPAPPPPPPLMARALVRRGLLSGALAVLAFATLALGVHFTPAVLAAFTPHSAAPATPMRAAPHPRTPTSIATPAPAATAHTAAVTVSQAHPPAFTPTPMGDQQSSDDDRGGNAAHHHPGKPSGNGDDHHDHQP